MTDEVRPPEVVVVDSAAAGAELALAELEGLSVRAQVPLVSFATGATFAGFFELLAGAFEEGRIQPFMATHLDEYLGFGPDRPGGMVHELMTRCPPLTSMLRAGTFLPVPGLGSGLATHAELLRRAGSVRLQFLGIGRNGHLGFNEPGTPFDSDFHVADLSPETRADARSRFAPAEPPRQGVTAGIGTILSATRCVLLATGERKAAAVAAMLHGKVGPHCPASALRGHGNVLVVLDRDAARGIPQPRSG